MKKDLEFKVGLFVVAALGLLAFLVLRAGELYLRPGYTVTLEFDTVSGIDKGAPVKLSGVSIGEVKKVRAVREEDASTHVEIEAFIDEGVVIEEDSDMRVATMGFLGEKYVEIYPGTPAAKPVAPGGRLVGRQLTGVDDLFDSGQKLIQKMEYVAEDIRKLVGDVEFQKSLKGTFANSEVFTHNLIETSDNLKTASASAKVVLGRLENGEGTVGRLLKNDQMAKDLESFAADIKKNPWKLLKRG